MDGTDLLCAFIASEEFIATCIYIFLHRHLINPGAITAPSPLLVATLAGTDGESVAAVVIVHCPLSLAREGIETMFNIRASFQDHFKCKIVQLSLLSRQILYCSASI